ncbi:unnamed protein product [Boreogadus saida]
MACFSIVSGTDSGNVLLWGHCETDRSMSSWLSRPPMRSMGFHFVCHGICLGQKEFFETSSIVEQTGTEVFSEVPGHESACTVVSSACYITVVAMRFNIPVCSFILPPVPSQEADTATSLCMDTEPKPLC